MIDDGYDDLDYVEAPLRRWGRRWLRRWGAVVYKWTVGIGAIAAVAFGAIYLLNAGPGGGDAAVAGKGGIPLIQASRGPVKVRPVEPGGRVVPHQNREVYREVDDAQRKGRPKTRVEDLLAPGSRAATRRAARRTRYELVADGATCAKSPTLAADLGRLRAASWRLATRDLNGVSTSNGDTRRDVRGKTPARGDGGGADSSDVRREDSMAGAYRIQLGAFRSPTKAQKRWRGLKRRHRSLLGRLNMVIERVDLGPRGIFYRLQAGPIRSERSARGLCRTLGKRKINCILVSG